MNRRCVGTLALVFALAACGSGGGSNGGGGGTGGTPPTGTTITATFSSASGAPMPNVVATSSGSLGTWSIAALTGGTLQFTLPSGTSTYGIAYYCNNDETIFEANVTDTASPKLGCLTSNSNSATFSYDVSAIAGASAAQVDVANANTSVTSGKLSSVTGSTSISSIPSGSVDVMIKAFDNSGNLLAAEIIRGMSITSGGTYGLQPVSAADDTTIQAVSASGVPAGWSVTYSGAIILADGTRFFTGPIGNSWYAVPAASQVQPGDYYFADAQAAPVNNAQFVAAAITANAPPASLALPAPFTYGGPAAADDPTFTFNYSGTFSITGTLLYQATMQWSANSLALVATKGAVGTNPSLVVPNLAAVSALFPNLPSGGASVNWSTFVLDEDPMFIGNAIPNNLAAQLTWSLGHYVAP